jgi:hypothetical protein
MQKIPQIVIARLKAEAATVDHPDAGVLTAFAEKSLSEKERGAVMQHLARCADCREILVLSAPEPDHDREIIDGSAVGGWFTWPALRWGLVTAGLLIAGFGVLQYQRHERMSPMASRSMPAPITASEARNQAEPSPAPSDSMTMRAKTEARSETAGAEGRGEGREEGRADREQDRTSARPSSPAATPAATAGKASNLVSSPVMETLAHGPRMTQLNQHNQAAQQVVPAANAPVAAQTEQVQVEAQAMPQTLAVNGRDVTGLQRLDQPEGAESKVERVKRIDGIPSSAPKAARSSAAPTLADSSASIAPPRWTIGPTGALQRSFDQGRTWQDVNVTNFAVPAAEGARLAYSMDLKKETTEFNQNEKDAAKAKAASPIAFRAVSANGADVWAGGSSGMLYHSTDSGGHWIRIVPFTNDSFLTGDIVRVAFADPDHGKVTTSTSETWLTADDGKTWQKQ